MFLNALFIVSSVLTIASAFALAITKNIMHSCVFLLGSLIGVAGLYITLNADFVAAVQIMVYVGGVVILMLFAVMLTGGKDFMENTKLTFGSLPYMGNKKTYFWGILTATVFLSVIVKIVCNITEKISVITPEPFESTVEKIGHALVNDHILAFEISSILLLGALIGAAVIARPRDEEANS